MRKILKKVKKTLFFPKENLSSNPVNLPFIYHIDSPNLNAEIASTFVIIRGWIVAGSPIENPSLCNNTGTHKQLLGQESRPDVEKAYPGQYIFGFKHLIAIPELAPETSWLISFILNQNLYNFAIPFSVSQAAVEAFWNLKTQKLQKLLPTFRCPVCNGENLEHLPTTINCPNCHSSFSHNQLHYNFLTPDLIEYAKIKPTSNISTTGYDKISQNLIKKFSDGLILDNGCGVKDYYNFLNIVNFEIVGYPSTDVVGVGEKLPFKSNIFEAVFSFAVLEHVRNPFECAKEIMRVLKPGGTLYIQVPFLQPFHGYPDHYYNMTSSGLKNLFDNNIEILEAGVQDVGLPIWALTWFLNSYIQGLPADIAEQFKNMKIGELLDHPSQYLDKEFVTQLSPTTNEKLASVNYLIGIKK